MEYDGSHTLRLDTLSASRLTLEEYALSTLQKLEFARLFRSAGGRHRRYRIGQPTVHLFHGEKRT